MSKSDFPIGCRVQIMETPIWGPKHGVHGGDMGTVEGYWADGVNVMFDHQDLNFNPEPLGTCYWRLKRVDELTPFDVVY